MANRKRKLNTLLCSNKRIHVEQAVGKADSDIDSDSNHETNDHEANMNDNDDGASSRLSDFDDGECNMSQMFKVQSFPPPLFTIYQQRKEIVDFRIGSNFLFTKKA